MAGFVYQDIENAVIQMLLTEFPDRLDETRCVAGNIDGVFASLEKSDIATVVDGVVLEFGGGTSKPRQTIGNINWAWIIAGIWLIRYHPDIENALREVVSRIPILFQENPRLGGVTPLAYITEIGDPIIGKINDVSFYFVPFFIEALDQSITG